MAHEALLARVGARVRKLREQQSLSRRVLSARSGVSQRFLSELEAGRGNISLLRFAEVAGALGTTPALLLAESESGPEVPQIIALLGVRGAGKSSIGNRLAKRLGRSFVELDQKIEVAAGLSLAEIFELHGEAYYRRVEREVLRELVANPASMVLATGGSIVRDDESFNLLRARTETIWLRAEAEDHWNRVIEQGDERPMAANPQAFAELKALLQAREPLYARAEHVIDTSSRSIDSVVDLVVALLEKQPPASALA